MNDWKKEPAEQMSTAPHYVELRERAHIEIHGMTEVISFDELAVLLITCCGQMTIEGEGLHISRLDLDRGEADIDGTVSGIYYSKIKEKSGGFFRRLRD